MKVKKLLFFVFILFCLFLVSRSSDVKAETKENFIPLATSKPTPNGTQANGDYYYHIEVSEQVEIEDIATNIKLEAHDEYDGDLTSAIQVEDVDDYQLKVPDMFVNERTLGTYKIVYTVSDSSGNTSKLNVFVVVEDKLAPTVNPSSTLSYEEDIDNIMLSDETILENIHATDEFCNTRVTKEIVEGSLSELNREKDVPQVLKVKITDESGNYVLQNVSIILKDRTAPVIQTSSDTITTSYYANASIDSLLRTISVKVVDNYDTELPFKVTTDNYTSNKNTLGSYEVTLEASDTANNTGTKVIIVKVTDDIPPVFYLDISKVFVKEDVKLVKADFLSLLNSEGKIKNMDYDYYVLEDTYTNNANKEGKYNYSCRLSYNEEDYNDFKFEINVISDAPVKSLNLFQTCFILNQKIGNLIWNILKWPILQIKKLF